MDSLDPINRINAADGLRPLLSLGIFACLGAFFFDALFTALKKGGKEDGWFKLNKDTKEL